MQIQNLIGKQIIIRQFSMEDFEGIRSWVNSKTVTHNLMDAQIFTHEHSETETLEFLKSSLNIDSKNIRLVIADKKSNKYLGQIAIFNFSDIQQSCEFDIVIGNTEYWGKGIGTEIVQIVSNYLNQELRIKKIKILVKNSNQRAIHLALKNNFILENIENQDYQLGIKICG